MPRSLSSVTTLGHRGPSGRVHPGLLCRASLSRAPPSMPQDPPAMSLRRTTFLLAAGGGISVANIYYCQPLLGDMGRGFGVGEAPMGLAAAMTQAGTALGML